MESAKVVTVKRYGNTDPSKPELLGSVDGNRPVERPKLNLKPRSPPLEKSEETLERERLVNYSNVSFSFFLFLFSLSLSFSSLIISSIHDVQRTEDLIPLLRI